MATAQGLKDPERIAQLQEELKEASGRVCSNDPLVIFLYTLMRDKLPPGEVAYLMQGIPDSAEFTGFTNGWLARYAEFLAHKLRGE